MATALELRDEANHDAAKSPSIDERLQALERWSRRIEARKTRYPAEHLVDSERDRIYAEREDAQA